jgi:enoyl-CoA hydratase/carnithine racemase
VSETRIQLSYQDGIARLTINRPEKQNALSLAMWRAIPPALDEIAARNDVEAIVVEGAGGNAFAAGADLFDLEAAITDRAAGLAFMDAIHAAEDALARMERPTVALIRGLCFGGGLELAMACDVRLATDDARFMAPPARLGIAYSLSSTRRLMALVGESRATDMLFAPREIPAALALQWGLVTEVYDRAQFGAEAETYLRRLLRSSLFSIKSTKAIMQAVREGNLADTPAIRELRLQGFTAPDFSEGINAFREHRRAAFPWGRTNRTERKTGERP